MRVNAVSINLKKDEIVIKLKEDAKQEEIENIIIDDEKKDEKKTLTKIHRPRRHHKRKNNIRRMDHSQTVQRHTRKNKL